MTPEQALKEIDNLLSQLQLTRQQTMNIMKMVDVLSKAIQEKTE